MDYGMQIRKFIHEIPKVKWADTISFAREAVSAKNLSINHVWCKNDPKLCIDCNAVALYPNEI